MIFGGSYANSELRTDTPSLNAESGDPLPGAPDYNISLGLQYDQQLMQYPAFIRADYTYVGGFYNNLQETGAEAGRYGQANIRAGIEIEKFTIDLFVNNLSNEDAITWVGADSPDKRAFRLRPRTLGMSLAYHF